jgi:hypothetical protein
MQISQRKTTSLKKKKTYTPEEMLQMTELRLECARFELARLVELINRKSFVKRVQKDAEKLTRMMRRQRRAETRIDEYENMVLDIKGKMEAKVKEAQTMPAPSTST